MAEEHAAPLVEQPGWILSKVLLSPDLVPHILAQLPTKAHAVKGTCRAWRHGWKETLKKRERPRLLVIGGHGSDNELVNSLERYNPSTDEWGGEAVAPMPTARRWASNMVLNGKLYAAGGLLGGAPSNLMERYDFATSAWEAAAPMAAARCVHAVAVLDGKLYAVGGLDAGGDACSSVERYDPATNAWEAVAPMTTARDCHAVSALDGKLYAVGGRGYAGRLSSVERYDPALDAWEAAAPMATVRVGHAMAVLDGKLYAVGGLNAGYNACSSVERYDPAPDAWEAVAPMAEARHKHAVMVLDGKLYAVGGQDWGQEDGYHALSSVERHDLVTHVWEAVAPIATARRASIAVLM